MRLMILSECEKVFEELRDLLVRLDLLRMDLLEMSEKLYGTALRPSEFMERVYRDMARGLLEVRDNNLCLGRRCISLPEFIDKMRDYRKMLADRRKLLDNLIGACKYEV